MQRSRRAVLRHPEDVRSIAFVATHGLLATAGWLFTPQHTVLLVAWVLATSISSWLVAVIAHNTIHSPVFHRPLFNGLFQLWLSLSYGWAVSEFVPGHNLSHHKFTQKGADLMRTSQVRFRSNLLNFLAFGPVVALSVGRANFEFAARMGTTKPAWLRQWRLEVAAVWAVKLALVALDWKKALLFVLVPHFFAVWGIVVLNYLQHDGCDEDDPYNHSRNFVGRAFGWITFNNGFHGIHHMQPGLHWSLLAKAHAEKLHPFIHPALEQRSLAVYLWRTFIWPGRRVRYTGKPVIPLEVPSENYLDSVTLTELRSTLDA
jgi:fatty acid desaturase